MSGVTAAELWYDLAVGSDALGLIGTVSQLHVWINVLLTPSATSTEKNCPHYQTYWAVVLCVPLAGILGGWLQRACVEHDYEEISSSRRIGLGTRMVGKNSVVLLEYVVGLLMIVSGAVMMVSVKPSGWGVDMYTAGCDIFTSPPSLIGWLTGEVLAFGGGVRLLLLSYALARGVGQPTGEEGSWRFWLGVAVAVALVAVGGVLVWVSVAYLDPVMDNLAAMLKELRDAQNALEELTDQLS